MFFRSRSAAWIGALLACFLAAPAFAQNSSVEFTSYKAMSCPTRMPNQASIVEDLTKQITLNLFGIPVGENLKVVNVKRLKVSIRVRNVEMVDETGAFVTTLPIIGVEDRNGVSSLGTTVSVVRGTTGSYAMTLDGFQTGWLQAYLCVYTLDVTAKGLVVEQQADLREKNVRINISTGTKKAIPLWTIAKLKRTYN